MFQVDHCHGVSAGIESVGDGGPGLLNFGACRATVSQFSNHCA